MGSQDLQAKVIEHEWYSALTAEERLRAFSCNGTAGVADSPSPDRAARLGQWLEKRRILRPTYLADMNCSDTELSRILATAYEPDVLAQAIPSDWLYRLSEAATFDPSTELELIDFASFVAPFVGWAAEKLDARLAALATEATRFVIPVSLLKHSFADKLKGKLVWMSYRVLVLELNVARLQGRLEGASPQQRYCSFVKLLGDSGFRSELLREYPVLARQLSEYAAMWLEEASEFAERLYSDWNELKKRFPEIAQAGEIETLSLEQGDSHRRGRSVTIVNFKSGTRIVYKPRSMSLDVHFQQLLAWLNGQGISLPFRTISIWDRGAYGWSEFVPFAPCSTVEEIRRFYKRQGGYLALLYVLEATDFHAHNLIACCEHPMLVDLEGLLHPRYKPADPSSAAQLGNWAMGKSVIRVGLLPRNSRSSPDGGGLDLSGLGGEPGQAYPMRVPSWEGIGTDEMRYTEESRLYSGGENRPKLGGEHVQTSDYAKEIVEGF